MPFSSDEVLGCCCHAHVWPWTPLIQTCLGSVLGLCLILDLLYHICQCLAITGGWLRNLQSVTVTIPYCHLCIRFWLADSVCQPDLASVWLLWACQYCVLMITDLYNSLWCGRVLLSLFVVEAKEHQHQILLSLSLSPDFGFWFKISGAWFLESIVVRRLLFVTLTSYLSNCNGQRSELQTRHNLILCTWECKMYNKLGSS